ncbi:hypothetical protein OIU79_019775 [Salix purpurea]|uniref:Uncharacterized protein n=1 Tax=Salix purpurea TaxID=77065 RepID=A0A9Q0P200_SALPP|nr:hypothetical protein OIU79_019775 [Salix purpurea]
MGAHRRHARQSLVLLGQSKESKTISAAGSSRFTTSASMAPLASTTFHPTTSPRLASPFDSFDPCLLDAFRAIVWSRCEFCESFILDHLACGRKVSEYFVGGTSNLPRTSLSLI